MRIHHHRIAGFAEFPAVMRSTFSLHAHLVKHASAAACSVGIWFVHIAIFVLAFRAVNWPLVPVFPAGTLSLCPVEFFPRVLPGRVIT